jgi:hypothetical protein
VNASELIDNRIAELGDWRGRMIARIRKLVQEAAPETVEEWKWDTPVWTRNGNVLAVGSFKDHVKINFFQGALLEDQRLFNSGLEAKTTRTIDLRENESIDEAALKKLIRSAVEFNSKKSKPAKAAAKPAAAKKPNTARTKRFGKGRTS